MWPTEGNLSQCMMCVHVYKCESTQVCRGSRQRNRQAHWVPVRSGSRWSVSRNDTWQQLGGCGLAVLYIHVTTDKISACWEGETTVPALGTGSSIQDENRRMWTLPSACPSLSLRCSLSRQVGTAVMAIGWAGVKVPTLSVPEVGTKLRGTTWFGLEKQNLDVLLLVA